MAIISSVASEEELDEELLDELSGSLSKLSSWSLELLLLDSDKLLPSESELHSTRPNPRFGDLDLMAPMSQAAPPPFYRQPSCNHETSLFNQLNLLQRIKDTDSHTKCCQVAWTSSDIAKPQMEQKWKTESESETLAPTNFNQWTSTLLPGPWKKLHPITRREHEKGLRKTKFKATNKYVQWSLLL